MTQATIYFELVSKLQQVSEKLKSRDTSTYSDEEVQKDYDYLSQRLEDLLSIASSHSDVFKNWQVIKSYNARSINNRLKRVVDYFSEQIIQESIKPSDLSAIFPQIIATLLNPNPDLSQLNGLLETYLNSLISQNIIQDELDGNLSQILKEKLLLLDNETLEKLSNLEIEPLSEDAGAIFWAIKIESTEILAERKPLSLDSAITPSEKETIGDVVYKTSASLEADKLHDLQRQADENNGYELISRGLSVEIVQEELESTQLQYKQLREKLDKNLNGLSNTKECLKVKNVYDRLKALKGAVDDSIKEAAFNQEVLVNFKCIDDGINSDLTAAFQYATTVEDYMAKPVVEILPDIFKCLKEKVIDESRVVQLLEACYLKILKAKSITNTKMVEILKTQLKRCPGQSLKLLADLKLNNYSSIAKSMLENMRVIATEWSHFYESCESNDIEKILEAIANHFLVKDREDNHLYDDIYFRFLVHLNSKQLKAIKDKLNEADEPSLSGLNKAIKTELNSPRGKQLIAAKLLQEHIKSSVDELSKLADYLQDKVDEFNKYKLFDNLADIAPTVKDIGLPALNEQAKIEADKLKEIEKLKEQLIATSEQIDKDVVSSCMSTEKREQYVSDYEKAFEETIHSDKINTHTSTLYTVLNVLKSLLTKIKAAVTLGNEAQESINSESRYSLFKATHTRSTLEKIKSIPDEPTLDVASNNMPLNKN